MVPWIEHVCSVSVSRGYSSIVFFFFQAEDGIRDLTVTGVQTCALPILFGRLFHSSEDTGWTYGPYTQVPFNDGESISNNDIVLWYEGYLPHQASEGRDRKSVV